MEEKKMQKKKNAKTGLVAVNFTPTYCNFYYVEITYID